MILTDVDAAPNIARGVALLDEHAPVGLAWPHYVNLNTLDLSHGPACVVGQLFGDYTEGIMRLMALISSSDAGFIFSENHGFDVSTRSFGDSYGHRAVTLADYRDLTTAWRSHIELLRADRPLTPTT